MKPGTFAAAPLLSFVAICSKESALMLPALFLLVRAVWISPEKDETSFDRMAWKTRFLHGLAWDLSFLPVVMAYLVLRLLAVGGLRPCW